jgi:hypothetical protein
MFKLSKRNIITTLLVTSVVVSGVAFSFASEKTPTKTDGTNSVKEEYFAQRGSGKRFAGFCGRMGGCSFEEGLSEEQIESLKTLREEHREEMLSKVSEFKEISVDELKEQMAQKRAGMRGRMGKMMMNKNDE